MHSSRLRREPKRFSRMATDSSGCRRRSAALNTAMLPLAASSPVWKGRGWREPIITCRFGGALYNKYTSECRLLASGRRSMSSMINTVCLPRLAMSPSRPVSASMLKGSNMAPGGPPSSAGLRPLATRTECSSARLKREGSSWRSTVSQATSAPCASQRRRHCASKVVLPNPAGAMTAIAVRSRTMSQILLKRSRSTAVRGNRGGVVFRMNSGSDIGGRSGVCCSAMHPTASAAQSLAERQVAQRPHCVKPVPCREA